VTVDPYVYPGASTLRNRYGVRDPTDLARREATITAARLAELAERPIFGSYDLAHLQAVHRHIFADVYDWAGEIRTVVIAKDDLFALPENIVSYLGSVLEKLPAERHLRGLAREQVIDRLTYYLAEINATHPFREGNGRAQRAFVAQLAADAGYRVDWRRLDPQRNIDASRAAHRGDERPLRAILAEIVSRPQR
jgi:cell filamentation protein